MKRMLATILCALMLLPLAACGGDQGQTTPGGNNVQTPQTGNQDQTENQDQPSDDPILGVYSADTFVYENEFLGLGCQMDEDWDVFDTDEIAQLNGTIAESMTNEAIAEQLANSGVVQPFYAQAEDGLVTVNIAVENLGLLYGTLLDEQGYADQAVTQVGPALESLGMTDVSAEIGTADFAGSSHVAIYVSGTLQGVAFYEAIVCVKVDRYIACVTAGSYLTDVTGDVLGMFYSL